MAGNIKDLIRPKFDQINGSDTAIRALEFTSTATIAGVGIGAIIQSVNPQSLKDAAIRTGSITVTCAALGAIFATTTGVSATLRGKDTPLNYFVGGCATGLFLGARTQSMAIGSGTCAAVGSVAAFMKFWQINDWGPLAPLPKY